VKAKGTFRLQGPWQIVSADKIIEKSFHRCGREQLHHLPHRKHQHKVCFGEPLNL